jgi:hypothetical protein
MAEKAWDWTRTRQELALLLDRVTPDQTYQIVRALCNVEDESHLAAVLVGQIRGSVVWNEHERKRAARVPSKR